VIGLAPPEARLEKTAIAEYDMLHGTDWAWLSLDGAMSKASLGGR
jgi:hypothetical protein